MIQSHLIELKQNSLEKILYFSVLAVAGIWFLCMNMNTPFMHDDLAYCYYYDDNSALERPSSEPISSFWQIFPSMWNHYNSVNGRYTSHFLIQLFCSLLGKNLFNLFNTIIFLLFLDLIVVMSFGGRQLLPLCLSILSVVFFLPFPGQTMLWLTGSINYLWSSACSLIVLKIVMGQFNKGSLLCLLSFLFGLFSGWMNESISFGIGGGMVVYLFFNRNRFKGTTRWIIMGYMIGCVMILLSPGTLNRASSGEINTDLNLLQMFSSRLISSVFLMKSLPIIASAGLLIILACFKRFRSLFRGRYVFVYSFIITAIFCFLIGLPESRVFFGLSVLGTILCISAVRYLTHSIVFPHKIGYLVSFLLLVLCFPHGIKAINRSSEYSRYSKDIEERIQSSPSACVIEATPFESSRFVYATRVYANRYQFHNRVRSFYYHKEYVCAVPNQLYISYKKQDASIISDEYWFIKLDGSIEDIVGIRAHSSTEILLNKRQRIIRYLLGTLNDESIISDYAVLEYNSETLLIVPHQEAIDKLIITLKNGVTIEVPCE